MIGCCLQNIFCLDIGLQRILASEHGLMEFQLSNKGGCDNGFQIRVVGTLASE